MSAQGGQPPRRSGDSPAAVASTSVTPAAGLVLDDWLTPGRFAFILAGLIFASFPQVLLGWETFVVRDYGFFAFPVAHFQQACFWKGQLPVWNPYNNCGLPFLAQWNTMPLYPPALVYLLLPLTWSLSFFCLLHLFWGGLGMYFLAHRWTSNRLAAAAAGVIFAFNGLSLNLLMWPSHIATVSWMPWVVLSVERGWREGGRWLITGAIAGALQMLAGGPETILFTWIILSAFWLMAIWQERGQQPLGIVWRYPAMVCLVACLAAAQLLPFLDLATHSERGQGYADTRWSMPGWGWANFFVPMVFGSTWGQRLFFQYGQFWTSSYYLGLATLLAAAVGVWQMRSRRFWALAVISVIAVLLAGGDSNLFSRWARRIVPQLSLMTYPVKFLLLLLFTAPLLAAFGLSRLRSDSAAPARQRQVVVLTAALLALLIGILVWAWRSPFPQDNFPVTLRNGLSRLLFAVIAGAVLVALCRPWRGRLRRLIPLLLLLVLWLDVWTHEPTQNPTVPPAIYQKDLARTYLKMEPQPALGQSRAMVAPSAETRFMQRALEEPEQNFLAKRTGYFADCNLLDDVPKVNGFFSLYPRHTGELTSILYLSTNVCPASLADFLSVSQETAPEQYTTWRPRSTFMPWVTAGQQPVFRDDPSTLSMLVNSPFDTRRFVLLPPEERGRVGVTNQTEAQVRRQQFGTSQADLEVVAKEPSLVVISQTYYHQWRAYVDDVPAHLFRANYAFQAVQVPAGEHHVRLSYEDQALKLGGIISLLAAIGCIVGWILQRHA